jgi:DNA ligase-1
VRYWIVAEAYRDLEQLSSRLALTERLAALLAQTPAELLPTMCYLCQGLIAPEFAGVDLGMAEKLAVRALATAAGTDAAQVASLVRESGDLGQAAERLLALSAAAGGGGGGGLGLGEREPGGQPGGHRGGAHAARDRCYRGDGFAGPQA